MLSLFFTKEIGSYLNDNLKQYEILPSKKFVIKSYKGSTKSNETFEIDVYNTGTIIINGSLQKKIYTTLFNTINEKNTTGYDEVGVGDFFGPTVYVSVFLDDKSIKDLSSLYLPIKDSKKLKDYETLSIYDQLKDTISYKKQIVFDKDISSLNSIAQKTYYHHLNIIDANIHILDLFTTVNSFHKYCKELDLEYPRNLILETKADSKYYSVALASIFARAIFIKEMNKLIEKYDFNFKYGANVKEQAKQFVKLYSKKELSTFCKTSFKTFDEI